MRRLMVLATVAAAVTFVAPTAHASKCTPPWYERETGLYNPLTGEPITYCEYRPRTP